MPAAVLAAVAMRVCGTVADEPDAPDASGQAWHDGVTTHTWCAARRHVL
jgi:hypothetical protein